MSFSVSYWYSPVIITFPSLPVVYSPISSVPLYSLNFAPSRYSTSVFESVTSSLSLTWLSIVFFIFIICKSYVGIFSSSNVMFIVGILSSSVVFWLAIVSFVPNIYPLLFVAGTSPSSTL